MLLPHSRLDCTVPYFGFKAKPDLMKGFISQHCTVPYFGFKAKPKRTDISSETNCTVPYFGFKAKLLKEKKQKK